MSFEPINEYHSIAEVVFAIHVSTNFQVEEIHDVKNAHDQWKNFLPRMLESQMIDVTNSFSDRIEPPVSFVRFRADGNIEWELLILPNTILMKCSNYLGWEYTWKSVRDVFCKVSKVLREKSRLANSVVLQYTDVFLWKGRHKDYDANKLLNKSSEYIPLTIAKNGPLWHLHQGWFREIKNPIDGKLLMRMHLDSLTEEEKLFVRIENLNRFDFSNQTNITPLNNLFLDEDRIIDKVFSDLHDLNKNSLREVLHPDLQKKIKLNA